MKRLALFAVFPYLCIASFGQSPTAAPENGSSDSAANFNLDRDGFGLIPASGEAVRMSSCDDPSTLMDQSGVGWLSHLPCLNAGKLAEMARLNAPAFPVMNRQLLSGKTVPIPTQWPNAKLEQIPTTWANLKLEPIQGQSHARPARR